MHNGELYRKIIWLPEEWMESITADRLRVQIVHGNDVYNDIIQITKEFYANKKPGYDEL